MDEKYKLIREAVLLHTETDPVLIANSVMGAPFVAIHGPEHHFLDGAALLCAYKNAGGKLDLPAALDAFAERTRQMPGAMCGFWGVCGSVASVGAALSVIHGVGPLSADKYYSSDMVYTSNALKRIAEVGGPRCCKRNAYLALSTAVEHIQSTEGIALELAPIQCRFSPLNKQCIGQRCPYNQQ